VERRLVAEEAVRELAVISARLSVVRGDDEQRRGLRCANGLEQRRQRGVCVGDLAEVEVVVEARPERLRRIVRRVRVVEMHPQEASFSLLSLPPFQRRLHDVLGARLLDVELELLVEVTVGLVVNVEVMVEPVSRVQHEGADECSSGVALRLQPRGRGRNLAREAKAGVLAYTVLVREHAREDVRVGRQGDDVVRVRPGEDRALGREAIEVRRRAARVAVEADGVVSERVDRDEDDVARDACGRSAGG
jgi:hypothetical protein